ncbi:MAG: AMP-binding protein [Acidimicrobiia bacterium]|nr:AMP-binding protein [Acidimicrobiia bacterium]
MPAVDPGPKGISAHVDTFTRDNLPPLEQWPEMNWGLDMLAYPSQLNCSVELLVKAVDRGWGNRPCTMSAEGAVAYTYIELNEVSNQIANVLVDDLGLVPGNRVLLHCFNNPYAVAIWFAIVKAGGVVVATMPLLRSGELKTILDKARVGLAIADARLIETVEDVASEGGSVPVPYDGNGDRDLLTLAASKSTEFQPVDTAADDVVLLAFTSGTTGVPKCTMHFHRDVLATADTFQPVLQATGEDVFCGSPPLAFTFGLGGLVVFPMRVGASTVLTERPGPPLLQAIQDHSVTICFTAPTAYRAMADQVDEYDLSSLSKGVSAGETLPEPTFHAFRQATGVSLIDGLGSTEMLHIFISASGDEIRPGSTGKPLPGVEARVVGEDLEELPPGEVGRLAVRGPTGCRYLNDRRQSEYVQDGWNLTGDSYIVDEDGYFWFQARADDMIISSGYNIAGPEVEASLLKHQAVVECGVVGVPDDTRGQVVKAFVVLREGRQPSEELAAQLKEFVKDDIAAYKYPRQIEFIAALPKTETGKIQRYKLRERAPG